MTDSTLLSAALLATSMTDKIALMWPEIILFATTCVVLIVGLSPSATIRKSTGAIAAAGLAIATLMAHASPPGQGGFGAMMPYAKALIGIVGLLMVGLMAGTVDRRFEAAIEAGRAKYQPLLATRAEFYAFFLFSLTGAMLCAGANDLIWLFLALELTSLPTYVMVVISTRGTRSQESGVKYFFLGALGAAIFLMGFALLFGGTGSTMLFGTPSDPGIAEILAYQTLQFNGINPIAMAGLVLAVIGIGFKIAAVPMHFYTADVYQGASSTVSAFLAFVPKTAGFIALIVLLGTVGWGHDTFAGEGGQLPGVLRTVLWVMAVLTMFVGNILALVQTSAKRMLAYSSIAHSGYMLVGLIAGPGDGTFRNNGIAAVLFYLTAYGVMNLGAFAVIACLEKANRDSESGDEPEDVADLKGLCKTHPLLGWSMVLCAISLLGMPPLLGFWGKLPLFTAGIGAGEIVLVVILGINSAIAAFYYLRLAGSALLEEPDEQNEALRVTPFGARTFAAALSAGGVVSLSIFAGPIMGAAETSGRYTPVDNNAIFQDEVFLPPAGTMMPIFPDPTEGLGEIDHSGHNHD